MLAMIFSLFVGLSPSAVASGTSEYSAVEGTGYDSADDVVYVTTAVDKYGEIIHNWGVQGETCVFLSVYAEAFYTGIYVFEDMSQTQGGTSQSNAHSSALYSELKTLMTSKHTHITSYDETKSLYKYTDCQNGGGKISSFYSGKEIGPSWDSGATWNREHTWPRSKCVDKEKRNDSADIMMLRPTWVQENSDRGNMAYGLSGGFFEPADDVKGDRARIVLYGYTRWGNTDNMWGTSGVIESLAVLLEWMEEDPVDTWEMGRNDAVQSITGTRNVFVDYPEYAWLLFGRNVPEDYSTPSQSGGATVPPSTDKPVEDTTEVDSTAPAEDIPMETPEVGVAYKAKIVTPSNGTFYMTGTPMSESQPWYIKVSNDRNDGIDIFVEKSGEFGGFRLYFMDGANKTYIRAYERTDKAGSGTLELTTTKPTEYYTYDRSLGTFITSSGDNSFYLGTRLNGTKLYENISCSNTSYVTGDNASKVGVSQFVLEFVLSEQSIGGETDETSATESTEAEEVTTVVDETTDSEGATTEEGTKAEEGTKTEEGTKSEEGTNPEEGTSSSGKPIENETTTVETGKQPGVDDVDNSTEAEIPINLNKLGCGSSLCGGIAIIISVSAAGIIFCRKKKD